MRHSLRLFAVLILLLFGGSAIATYSCNSGYGIARHYGSNAIYDSFSEANSLRTYSPGRAPENYERFDVCFSSSWPNLRPFCQAFRQLNLTNQIPYNHYYAHLYTRTEMKYAGKALTESNDKTIYDEYKARNFVDIWEIDRNWGNQLLVSKIGETDLGWYTYASCFNKPSIIAYLNGIFTTAREAENSLAAIENEMGSEYASSPLKYQILYNQTGCDGAAPGSCMADIVETFGQRQKQLNSSLQGRWEIFWDALKGRHTNQNSSTGDLLTKLGGLASTFGLFISDIDLAIKNKQLELLARALSLPFRDQSTKEIMDKLGKNGTRNQYSSTLIIAHSQGNLFATSIQQKYPEYSTLADHLWTQAPISFIHVAPPTASLFGRYLTADIDWVIKGLALIAPTSIPPANVILPISTNDPSGHGFRETYWDRSRPAFGALKKMITDALDKF